MLAQGTTFRFLGTSYNVTAIRAQGATPELVDMSQWNRDVALPPLVRATGALSSPATVEIELIGSIAISAVNGRRGQLQISGPLGGYTEEAICNSVEISAQVGDVVRGSARFTITAQN